MKSSDEQFAATEPIALAAVMSDAVRVTDEGVHLSVDLSAYRLVAIKKAGYRLAARFTAQIGANADSSVAVLLRTRTPVSAAEARELVRMFYEELLDQELREQVGEETAPLRALILAHAFSRTGLVRE